MNLRICSVSNCVMGFNAYDFNPYISLRNCHRKTRSSSEVRFDHRKPRKHQLQQSTYRAVAFVNRLRIIIENTNPTCLKQRPLRVLLSFFNDERNELAGATRKM